MPQFKVDLTRTITQRAVHVIDVTAETLADLEKDSGAIEHYVTWPGTVPESAWKNAFHPHQIAINNIEIVDEFPDPDDALVDVWGQS